MSTELQRAQRDMARYLRDPDQETPPPGIERRRLEVYRDLVYRNIEGFISSAFPILRSLYSDADWARRVRRFIRSHRCETPLFLRISEEFLAFLATLEPTERLPFELELAHYEWLELAVDVAEGEVPGILSDPDDYPLEALQARLSPVAQLGCYQFPVHRIGTAFRPAAASEPSFLLVYRDREARVQFMELSAGSARLIQVLLRPDSGSVASRLSELASEWGMPLAQVQGFGWSQLKEFNAAGIIALEPDAV
jgi:hypothetical protein